MTAYKRPTRLAAPLLITLLAFTTSVMVSEVVEPGETQEFTEGDDCIFTPFSDRVLKGTAAGCVAPARVEAAAILSIAGFNNDVEAFATLVTNFVVTPGDETVLGATVSAVVDWDGVCCSAREIPLVN